MPGAGVLGLALFLAGGFVMRVPADVPVPVGFSLATVAAQERVVSLPLATAAAQERVVSLPTVIFEESRGISLESLRLRQYQYPDQGLTGSFSESLTQRPTLFGEEKKALDQSA